MTLLFGEIKIKSMEVDGEGDGTMLSDMRLTKSGEILRGGEALQTS